MTWKDYKKCFIETFNEFLDEMTKLIMNFSEDFKTIEKDIKKDVEKLFK